MLWHSASEFENFSERLFRAMIIIDAAVLRLFVELIAVLWVFLGLLTGLRVFSVQADLSSQHPIAIARGLFYPFTRSTRRSVVCSVPGGEDEQGRRRAEGGTDALTSSTNISSNACPRTKPYCSVLVFRSSDRHFGLAHVLAILGCVVKRPYPYSLLV
jgi:hypothetical protein